MDGWRPCPAEEASTGRGPAGHGQGQIDAIILLVTEVTLILHIRGGVL